jgi:pyruvate,orthophosphate dikinase
MVLNLGLNDECEGSAHVTGDERFACDSCDGSFRCGRIVRCRRHLLEHPLEVAKQKAGTNNDAALPASVLKALCKTYLAVVKKSTGQPFPQRPSEQLRGAIEAVFKSWNGARAIAYRVREKISHDLGTAVNVQAMVFGNRDDNSGTGVGFTRNAATGENVAYGEFLVNAQGEDVVAGIRNTETLAMAIVFPGSTTNAGIHRLEAHYRDMCNRVHDRWVLWMLPAGKRTGAPRWMAVEMTKGTKNGAGGRWSISRMKR